MGIKNFWEFSKEAASSRVPFPQFISQFVRQHGRVPRLAIDLYSFMYQAYPSEGAWSGPIRATMAKLMYLTSLNITYVVVFDGKRKPIKLRNIDSLSDNTNQDELPSPLDDFPSSENLESNESLYKLRNILREYRIDYVEAPAEAEAECAMLQKTGVVDYVLSNDSDTLVFGATAILKSFRKSVEEHSPHKHGGQPSEYYITPVHLADIEEKFGLDTKRLVLLATIRGGDYSKGLYSIGITRAIKIAQCGTSFIKNSKRDSRKQHTEANAAPLPDLAEEFVSCFYKEPSDPSTKIFNPCNNERPDPEREQKLSKFNALLNKTVLSRSKEIFGRKFSSEDKLLVDAYFAKLYLFPSISTSIYKFLPISLSFGELEVVHNDLKIPSDNTFVAAQENVIRNNAILDTDGNGIAGESLLIFSEETKHGSHKVLSHTFHPRDEEKYCERSDHLVIPPVFHYNFKNIVLRLLSQFHKRPELKSLIEITNQKTVDGVDYLFIKFDSKELAEVYSGTANAVAIDNFDEDDDTTTRSPSRSPERGRDSREKIWLPYDLVSSVNHGIVEDFINRPLPQPSPRKRKQQSPQKTKLDSFGKFPASPTKRHRLSSESPTKASRTPQLSPTRLKFNAKAGQTHSNEQTSSRSLQESEHGGSPSKQPLKRSPSKKRRSNSASTLPGQSLVTSFFNHSGDNPFVLSGKDQHDEELLLSDFDSDVELVSVSPTKRGPSLAKVPTLQHTESLVPPYPNRTGPSKPAKMTTSPKLRSSVEVLDHMSTKSTKLADYMPAEAPKSADHMSTKPAKLSRDVSFPKDTKTNSIFSMVPGSLPSSLHSKSKRPIPSNVVYVLSDSDDEGPSVGSSQSTGLLDRLMHVIDEEDTE